MLRTSPFGTGSTTCSQPTASQQLLQASHVACRTTRVVNSPPSICKTVVLQGRADMLAMELEASRAQAAQADAEAAETEAAFRLLQAEVNCVDPACCVRMVNCSFRGGCKSSECLRHSILLMADRVLMPGMNHFGIHKRTLKPIRS